MDWLQIDEETELRFRTFMPYTYRKLSKAFYDKNNFVHYTSAAVAMSIIQKQEVWLRNMRCMNDFSEVQHGLELLVSAYNTEELGGRLLTELDDMYPGFRADFQRYFSHYINTIKDGTYVVCLSEHDSSEDRVGRLSMWRAYGNQCGVALVLSKKVFLSQDNAALNAFSSPVLYADRNVFFRNFKFLSMKFVQIRNM